VSRPDDPPLAGNRFFTEHSPRWVSVPSLVGSLGVLVLMGLYALPDDANVYVGWVLGMLPLGAMAVLARRWRSRVPVSAWELEYLRVGIGLLTISGLAALSGGAWPLTLLAGPAFYAWTVVEKRRTP
jgi:hypothetical protein